MSELFDVAVHQIPTAGAVRPAAASLRLVCGLRTVVALLAVLAADCWPRQSAAAGPTARMAATVQPTTLPLLATHCLKCHGPDDTHGGFRLDTLSRTIDSVDTANRWQKVLGALNSGEMPPKEEKQLDSAAKTELLDDLAQVLVMARKALEDTGGLIGMRRLNRREYVNTLGDLLGVKVEPRGLPSDGAPGTFDTVGNGLFISADQIEQYHELATEAIQQAWRRYGMSHPTQTHRVEAETAMQGLRKSLAERVDQRRRFVLWKKAVEAAASKPENQAAVAEIGKAGAEYRHGVLSGWRKLQGAPSPTEFGFQDVQHAMYAQHGWENVVPHIVRYVSDPGVDHGAFVSGGTYTRHYYVVAGRPPGAYILRLRVAASADSPVERRFLEYIGPGLSGCFEITGSMEKPQLIEIPFEFAGDEAAAFTFQEKGTKDSIEQEGRVFFSALHANGIGPPLVIWIDWVEAEGPLPATRQPEALAELLTMPISEKSGSTPASGEQDVRGAFERFATRAFRGRKPESSFLDKLVGIYEQERTAGRPFRDAVTESLAVVLSSPRFLYLVEPTTLSTRRKLDGLELASRLSYFLWSGPPDDMLLALGQSGQLHKPEVLAGQVERMIDDPKSRQFTAAFTNQWLGIDRLDFFQFSDRLFPQYDLPTKAASRQEILETFGFLLHENLSLRNLLKSDFVIVNSILGRYYGLEGVHGDEYRMVKLPPGSPRGGLLGMAAISAMGSNGEHSSPVERGAWVLRKLLHAPTPPAPPNVPQLARLEGKLLTTRERVSAHQEEPQCASCHRKIDPIGFGLENFDAVGLWRTKDAYTKDGVGTKEWEISAAGAFHNGPAFQDYFELRDLIAARHEDFAIGFTEALLAYALGRPVGFSDSDLVKQIVARTAAKDYPLREFLQAVVASPAFQHK